MAVLRVFGGGGGASGDTGATAGYVFRYDAQGWLAIPASLDAPSRPGDAVWAGNRVIVVGGTEMSNGMHATRSDGVWALRVSLD